MEQRIEKFWHRVYFNLEKGYLRACIDRAYRDFNRTLRLSQYAGGEWDDIRESLAQVLEKRIVFMMNTKMVDQEEFDKWHQTTMMHLVSNEDIDVFISPTKYLTIGQAQKWINMSLKYIYAVGENHIKNSWTNYTYYHIPIDSIIQKCLTEYDVKPLEMAWSKLNEVYRYDLFQKECRIAFPKAILIEVEMDLFNQTLNE